MVILGADHDGFCLKEAVITYSEKNSIPYHDHGCYSGKLMGYASFVSKVACDVVGGRIERGILCCDTGIGISIAANKVKRIRAAVCTNKFCTEATHQHNDVNILRIGGRMIDEEMAVKLTKISLETPFDDGRRVRKVTQIKGIEDGKKL